MKLAGLVTSCAKKEALGQNYRNCHKLKYPQEARRVRLSQSDGCHQRPGDRDRFKPLERLLSSIQLPASAGTQPVPVPLS